MRKTISIITPAYNEEATIRSCVERVREVMATLADRYDYEHVLADNCSTDQTLVILKKLAAEDLRVKVLSFSRNFGGEKSGFTALRHAQGDAVIPLVADLQDPPECIPDLVQLWEEGFETIYGVYTNKSDGWIMKQLRSAYYKVLERLSEEALPRNYSGFGLLDRKVVDEVVKVDDHAPYTRGIIASVGFRQTTLFYERAPRAGGASKHGLGFLFHFGINAIISYSLVPLRLATYAGLTMATLSIFLAFAYALVKLINWNFQAPGATTVVVLVLFFSGVQLFFLGVLGEYIGAIHAQVRRKPFIVIREKINFD